MPYRFAAVGSTWANVSTLNILQHFTASQPKSTLDMKKKLTTASTFHTSSMPESKLYRYFKSAANHVKAHESHLYLQVTLRAKTAMLHSASSCHSSFARPSKLEQPHHAQIAIPRHGSSCTAAVQADSRELLKI